MKYIRFFEGLGLTDVSEVGGKNASLGEMYNQLTDKGIKIPNGFASTATAYRHYIQFNKLQNDIAESLRGLDTGNNYKIG